MASADSGVPKSVPSSLATPLTSTDGSSTSSTHRSCLRCTRRMSSLTYIIHTFCVACRDVQCSVKVRCNECNYWSDDFMLGYVKHRKYLVSKGKTKTPTAFSSSSSSLSRPPAVQTAAPASTDQL